MTVTDDELARLEALAQAATPGPWVSSNSDRCRFVRSETAGEIVTKVERWSDVVDEADAAFIAAARDAVPALVAEVRRLRAHECPYKALVDHANAQRDALRAENERLRESLRIAQGNANIREGQRDMARAEAAELRASLADAAGRMEHALDIVSAARWHRHGFGKDPTKLLHDAVDAYEASLPGLVAASPGGGDAP